MLLVGGDSFGLFDAQHEHWASIISNSDTSSCALGGRDLAITSVATLQELYTKKYSHCIFFITNFARVSVKKGDDTDMDIIDKVLQIFNSPEDMYKQPTVGYDYPCYTSLIKEPNRMERNYPNKQEKISNSLVFSQRGANLGVSLSSKYRHAGGSYITDEDEHNSNMVTYFKMLPDFEFFHNKVSYLALIKVFCENNNIKLLFVSTFNSKEWRQQLKDFLKADFFELSDVEGCDPNTLHTKQQWRGNRSHYDKEEHKKIAEHFKTVKGNWYEIN